MMMMTTTRRTSVLLLVLVALMGGGVEAARRVGGAAAAPKGGPAAAKPAADPCATFGCLNASKCVVTGKDKVASCKCHPGTTGAKCETVSAGNFFDAAALKVKPCPVNNYCTGTGGPIACPAPGSFTTGAMKKQLSDCKVKPGYYCPSYPNGVCAPAPCPAGSYCPGKTSVTDTTTPTIKPCPACTGAECTATSPPMSSEVTQCTCVCPTCADGLKNQSETDVDCGGPNCPTSKCANGKTCVVDGDCVQGSVCNSSKVCAPAPTCSDDIANQDETDKDCGGLTCSARCTLGQACKIDGDCGGGSVCTNLVCSVA